MSVVKMCGYTNHTLFYLFKIIFKKCSVLAKRLCVKVLQGQKNTDPLIQTNGDWNLFGRFKTTCLLKNININALL